MILIVRAINEIFRHIKQSTKKTLINKISSRLLGLECKLDKMIKSNAMKLIIKKILLEVPMETYCVSCNKNTKNETLSVRKTKQNRLMLQLIKFCCFWPEKLTFIKNQELHNFINV